MELRKLIQRVACLFLLILFLGGCNNMNQEMIESGDWGSSNDIMQTDAFPQQSGEDIIKTWAAEKSRIIDFWEAHNSELQKIAVSFIAFQTANAERDLPYATYRPSTGVIVSDGLSSWKAVKNPELEKQIHNLTLLADFPFECISADTQHGQFQTDSCAFLRSLSFCRISLLYYSDAEYELPNGIDFENVAEHWAIVTEWDE